MIYKIMTLHKCGSSLIQSLLENILKKDQKYKLFISHQVNEETNNNKLSDNSFILYRKIFEEPNNSFIFLRHPLNRLISQYYSFGWTHKDEISWEKDEEKAILKLKEFNKRREEIKKQTLNEYVLNNLNDKIKDYETAIKLKNIVIPYEVAMENPYLFFKFLCKKAGVNRDHVIPLFMNCKSFFEMPKMDRSDEIINKGLITHKRIYDRDEFYKKLSDDVLSEAVDKIGHVLSFYEEKLEEYKDIKNINFLI